MSSAETIAFSAVTASEPRRRALRVIADGHKNRRPVTVSGRTTGPGARLLTVARRAADSLVRDGFCRFDSPWEVRLELTADGRELCRELGL